ncbi:MAG: ferredoxin reductase family protein [Planctomycetes bacterium]|nr:ferredoxin reductase family protein [Planctomycetota bacterium]
MRALPWIACYVALALAPLAVAAFGDPIASPRPWTVEFATALGLVAFGVIAVEFALVSRLHVVARPFGNDVLMRFHRQMGFAAVAFAVGHAICALIVGTPWSCLWPHSGSLGARSGSVALWCLVALVATSVLRRRVRLPYEIWQRLHRWLALATTLAMLVHALALGSYVRAPAVRIVLIGSVAVFLALLAHYRVVRPLRAWGRPWELAALRHEGGDTRTLVLRPVGHAGFAFEPGQFVWLSTGATPFNSEEHPLSIASSAAPAALGRLELAVKALGDWSREVVPRLQPGARVWLDGPFGAFSLDRVAAQELVMIAGGIGVSPMRSMLLSMRDRGDPRRATLFYASRNRSRAPFAPHFEALAKEMNLRLVLVHEERDEQSSAEHGYVTAELLKRHLPGSLERTVFFVCGPLAMMDAVEDALAQLGVDASRIRTERFDMV